MVIGTDSFSATTVPHTFRINPAGGGSVVGGGISCPSVCTYRYTVSSTPVTYTAIPAANYRFLGWENITSIRSGWDYTSNPFQVIRTTSWNFSANFEYVPPPPPPAPTPTPPPPPAPAPTPTPTPTPSVTTNTNTGNSVVKKKPPTVTNTKKEDIVAPVEDKEPPTIPEDLIAEYFEEDSAIYLSWTMSSDNQKVAGYELERVEKGKTDWTKLNTAETVKYTDVIFEYDKTYQYRVRAYDQVNNYSGYSAIAEVATGSFEPNVTVKDGGEITDQDGNITYSFNPGAVPEDIFLSIEKMEESEYPIEAGSKIIGSAYDVIAKNSKGEEVTSFNSQINIRFKYTKNEARGANPQTIKIATLKNEKVEYLRTKVDVKTKEAKTLTDHLSAYMLIGEKSNSLLLFLKILLWVFVIIGITFAGYFAWLYQQKQKYLKEHREDYIYKH